MKWPAPTRADHDRFCRIEGWVQVRDATGRTGTHHLTCELVLHDGRILRTGISHPPNRATYGARIWAHILRDQLHVDEATFWATVRDGVAPQRSRTTPPGESLPVEIAALLVNRVGLSSEQIAALTRDEAIERLNRFWAEGS